MNQHTGRLKRAWNRLMIWYGMRDEPEPEERPCKDFMWERYPIEMKDTEILEAINTTQVRELQRYLSSRRQSGHHKPPQRVTGPIHLHAIHLQSIQTTEEMQPVKRERVRQQ